MPKASHNIRKNEIELLDTIWRSKEASLVAIYGRRRVGKTHLVREFFSNKGIFVEFTGQKNAKMHLQLSNFSQAMGKAFHDGAKLMPEKNWHAQFEVLTKELKKIPAKKKITLFFDELPWLATKRSGLIAQLDYFWNTIWSQMKNLNIILCGSAASWMLDNLINAKGGLHNRLTHTLLLRPLDLLQTKALLNSLNIQMNDKQLLDIFMVTGGIPHYLKHLKPSQSAVQNINRLCFKEDGLLYSEHDRIFASLFDNAQLCHRVVKEIAQSRYGISIQKLAKKIRQKTGGTLTKKLNELEAAGFIKKYVPYGKSKRDQFYRVIDEYAFFYQAFIEKFKNEEIADDQTNYWQLVSQTPRWLSWAGYAFESICLKHISKIRRALELDNIHCRVSNWQYQPQPNTKEQGAQIDLLMDRADGIINLIEIKYCHKKLTVDKKLIQSLMKKADVLEKQIQTKKQVKLVLITTHGVKNSASLEGFIDYHITLADILNG